MRRLAFESIVRTVADLCIQAAYELPEDVLAAVRRAIQTESNPQARLILQQLLENAHLAASEHIPICQDTGLTVVFADVGCQTMISAPEDKPTATLADAIQQGVAAARNITRQMAGLDPLPFRYRDRGCGAASSLNRCISGSTQTPTPLRSSI